MVKNDFYYPSTDGKTNIHAVLWLPEEEPVAVLHIAHGITEHMLRYEALAEYLTGKGYAVVGNENIGHGLSVSEGAEKMYFGPNGSWNYLVKDMYTCKEKVQERLFGIPYCMLGFSLGSFLVRTYLIDYPEDVDAAILIGTGKTAEAQIAIAKWVVNREAAKFGEAHTSPMIKKLTFETYNKKFAPNRTDFDWLCANEKAIDEYIADELCGSYYSAGAFREMLNGMSYTGKGSNAEKMDVDTPILILTGENDPVAENGKGIKRTCQLFKKAGVRKVQTKFYPGMRHDILHEEDCKQVFQDIYNWLKKNI